jgi:hypothetical protein
MRPHEKDPTEETSEGDVIDAEEPVVVEEPEVVEEPVVVEGSEVAEIPVVMEGPEVVDAKEAPGYWIETRPSDALVIHCGDPRFQAAFRRFITEELGISNYMPLIVGGGIHAFGVQSSASGTTR